MDADLRSYLHSTQRRPDVVSSVFQERHVRYAAQPAHRTTLLVKG